MIRMICYFVFVFFLLNTLHSLNGIFLSRTCIDVHVHVLFLYSQVAMMLESTYFAVHSCFRALLGVAEHFSNIK